MKNKFNHLKNKIEQASTIEEVQELIFRISEEKMEVVRQTDGLMVYAETSYLYQLERYAQRKLNELSDKRFGFLNAYFITSRKVLDREQHTEIKNIVNDKINN